MEIILVPRGTGKRNDPENSSPNPNPMQPSTSKLNTTQNNNNPQWIKPPDRGKKYQINKRKDRSSQPNPKVNPFQLHSRTGPPPSSAHEETPLNHNGTWSWRRVFSIRKLLKRQTSCRLHNGQTQSHRRRVMDLMMTQRRQYINT